MAEGRRRAGDRRGVAVGRRGAGDRPAAAAAAGGRLGVAEDGRLAAGGGRAVAEEGRLAVAAGRLATGDRLEGAGGHHGSPPSFRPWSVCRCTRSMGSTPPWVSCPSVRTVRTVRLRCCCGGGGGDGVASYGRRPHSAVAYRPPFSAGRPLSPPMARNCWSNPPAEHRSNCGSLSCPIPSRRLLWSLWRVFRHASLYIHSPHCCGSSDVGILAGFQRYSCSSHRRKMTRLRASGFPTHRLATDCYFPFRTLTILHHRNTYDRAASFFCSLAA